MVSQDHQSSKRWFQHLLHPSWLAGIISVGFHGSIFAAGPTFSGLNFELIREPALIQEGRKVPLVELTLEEQQRLPDFSQSFYNFENFGALPSLDPLLEEDSSESLLENSTGNSTSTRSNDFSNRFPWGSPQSGISLSESRSQPPPLAVAPPLSIGTGLPPITDASGEIPDLSQDSGGEDSVNSPDGEPQLGSEVPEIAKLESDGADLDNITVDTTQVASLPPDGLSPDESSDASDSDASDNSSPDDVNAAVPSADNEAATLRERLQRIYAYNPTWTTLEEADARFESWLEAGKPFIETPPFEAFEVLAPIQVPVDYGQQRCLQPAPQDGQIGVLISAEGKKLQEPQILKSTGYFFIHQQVGQYINNLDFSSIQSPTAVRFDILINYDPEICIDLGQGTGESQGADTHQDSESAADAELVDEDTVPEVIQ